MRKERGLADCGGGLSRSAVPGAQRCFKGGEATGERTGEGGEGGEAGRGSERESERGEEQEWGRGGDGSVATGAPCVQSREKT